MKHIRHLAVLPCCLFLCSTTLAEHRTYLRGTVSVPGFQGALIEIEHTFGSSNGPQRIMKTSRWVHGPEKFEDDTIKDAHFPFEILDVDWASETIKTREAGEDHIYRLSAPDRAATPKAWFDLRGVDFGDFADLASELENRVLLLHPAVDRTSVSLAVAWTNQAPEKAQVTDALVNCLKERGISTVVDGAKFLQLVPAALDVATSPRSNDVRSEASEPGGLTLSLKGVGVGDLAQVYANLSGRRRTGTEFVPGLVAYFKTCQPLSKPELLYAVETFLAWSDAKVILGDDNTFRIAQASRAGKGR